MYVLENDTDRNRLGISVSQKVGNSVIRHHATRLISVSYRLQEDMFNSGLDIDVFKRQVFTHGITDNTLTFSVWLVRSII